jgi:hypothetical protein
MSVRVEDGIIRLEGDCGVEDAEPVFSAFSEGRATAVDLSGADKIHGAVAQALLRVGAKIVGRPADPFLADHVAPALEKRRPGGD